MPLASAEGNTAVADICVVAFVQLGDKLVGVGDGGGALYVVDTIVRAPECDIVGHCVVKQYAVLRHQADMGAEAIDVKVGNGCPVDKYLPFCAVVETRQEVDKGGLTGTRRTDNGNGFATRDGEVDIAEHIHGLR